MSRMLARTLVKLSHIMDALAVPERREAAHFIYRTYSVPLTPAERAARYRSGVTRPLLDSSRDSDNHPSHHRDAIEPKIVTAPLQLTVTAPLLKGGGGDVLPFSDSFLEFWSKYPKQVGKGAAFKAWVKGKCSGHTQEITEAIEKQREFLMRDGGKFIPNPATWLNQIRWLDDPPATLPDGLVSDKTKANLPGIQRWVDRKMQS